MRKDILADNNVYHIFTKSIAGFTIFNNETEFMRMKDVMRYYQRGRPDISYSSFIDLSEPIKQYRMKVISSKEKVIDIISYCFMPTHIHLVLRQLKDQGISIFMSNILNSYTRYFNLKRKRKGPLWEGRFKNVLVSNDEYLLHLTRYIHLNPVSAGIVSKPEKWKGSSFGEYLCVIEEDDNICKYQDVLEINPKKYKKFVKDGISDQIGLAKMKAMMLD